MPQTEVFLARKLIGINKWSN